ncbi:hypothetical protein C8R45DRAFT_982522 [Mycena sanguinolenta]|nr:hypothetical protein C8R45DRAFT_982522 [Mycena sanguinolenta]
MTVGRLVICRKGTQRTMHGRVFNSALSKVANAPLLSSPTMYANRASPMFQASGEHNGPIANHLMDVDLGYAEEAALFAEMKALKTRVAAHCANAERKRFKTQTTAFLRDIVQHLPENPMQISGARSVILANLAPGNLCPPTPAHGPYQNNPASVVSPHQFTNDHRTLATNVALSAPCPSGRDRRAVMSTSDSSVPAPQLVSTPARGQKRAREDPSASDSPLTYSYSRFSPGNTITGCSNTPEPSLKTRYTSTPRSRHSYPAFPLGPPETPSPRSSLRESPGADYLSSNSGARRSSSQRHRPARGSVVALEDEIPWFV